MEIKEILSRIGYVRNKANLSAREVSLRMGMSPQYVAQLESGRIVLTVEKLLKILEICEFPIERFFSQNIVDYDVDKELKSLIEALSIDKKRNIIEFIKEWLVKNTYILAQYAKFLTFYKSNIVSVFYFRF